MARSRGEPRRKSVLSKYEQGKPVTDVINKGYTEKSVPKITFMPDDEIFEETVFSAEILTQRLREQAFLNKGIKIELEDLRSGKKNTFHYEGGIVSFVKYLNRTKDVLHRRTNLYKVFA